MPDVVLLSHGSGGRKSAELVHDVFQKHFSNSFLDEMGDAAVLPVPSSLVSMTTDSFVVDPLFFPGGDIGKLAVCGTVNDLLASGATPLYLTAAFMIEEGFPIDDLRRIVLSMAETAKEANIIIVAGDTKVAPRGAVDSLFITTTGLGAIDQEASYPQSSAAAEGDCVIISGTIGDHGMAVMGRREGLTFSSPIQTDCAALVDLVFAARAACPGIKCMRDPTRGGLAAVLNELAVASGVCIHIDEDSVPVSPAVQSACDLFGIDPLHVANEGKMVFIVPQESAEAVLGAIQSSKYGENATIIGRVLAVPIARVHLRTSLGVDRILDMPSGEILPRIC